MATDLQTAYQNVLAQFNAGQYALLETLMHTDIVLKKAVHSESVFGLGNVVTYLNTQMAAANPQATVTTVNFHPSTQAKWQGATYGLAHGEGTYQDNFTNGVVPVHFCWTFVRDDTTRDRQLVNVFGHRKD
jgi:hypothetical protein